MKKYTRDASVDLEGDEVAVFLGKAQATPAMLADRHHPNGAYTTFVDKVEHAASEIHNETGRTVLIMDADSGDTLARYNERGLVFDEQNAEESES